jgi:LysM repeat protein
MSRHILIFLCLFIGIARISGQNEAYNDYIQKYKKLAIKEMERAGIPASIKLAQAILESNAGRSDLARRANNHFGIKCGNDWTGKTFEKEDDDYDEFGNKVKSCFRKYKDDEDSYIAHSEFLRDPRKANRYGFLFRINLQDYRRWAVGLRTSGYATGAGYDTKLINIIETYELHKLDKLETDELPGDRPDKPEELIAGLDVRYVNDVRVVFAKNNVTVQNISLLSGISIKQLTKYNERLPLPNDSLQDGYRIFLQPKRCSFREKKKWHYVNPNETIFDISQAYGVKLSKLLSRNRLREQDIPQSNERIKLKGFKISQSERPRLKGEPVPSSTVPVLVKEDSLLNIEVTPVPPVSKPETSKPTNPPTKPDTKPSTTPETKPPVISPTKPSESTGPASNPNIYIVVKGDTLYSISKKHSTSVDQLMKLNNLVSTVIFIGQELKIK